MKMRLALVVPALALLTGCASDPAVTTMTSANHTEYITDSRFAEHPRAAEPEHPRAAEPLPRVVAEPLSQTVKEPRSVPMAASYRGRVLYSSTRAPVAGVTVEIVEAKSDGKPTDRVLGTTRADSEGHFKVAPNGGGAEKVALVAAATMISAETGGDRRAEGYQVQTRLIPLGSLPFPNPAKPNTILIARRQVGPGANN